MRSDFSMEHVVFCVIKNKMERINIGTFPILGKLARVWFRHINLTPVSSIHKHPFKSSPMSKSNLILTIMVSEKNPENIQFCCKMHKLHEFELIIAEVIIIIHSFVGQRWIVRHVKFKLQTDCVLETRDFENFAQIRSGTNK